MVGKATYEPGAKLERIARKLVDPSVALKQIGALMVSESQTAFRAQSFGGKAWDERAPVNLFGIIADFAAGKSEPPARRFERRPVLADTGRLRQSIAARIVGVDAVEVGTNLDYASVHQFGGKVESKALTDEVRTKLWQWLRKQSRDLKKRIGWVLAKKFRGKTLTQTVPARPFIGITKQTRENVRRIIGVQILEVG